MYLYRRSSTDVVIEKRGRHWAIIETDGTLVCLTVYRRGAVEVIRRLKGEEPNSAGSDQPVRSQCREAAPQTNYGACLRRSQRRVADT